MDKPDITQAEIDEGVESARKQWALLLKESGLTQTLFICNSKKASKFLAEYEMVKEQVLDFGFDMPALLENVTVTLSEG